MSDTKRVLQELSARALPHRFLAAQLRRPSGRFGRLLMGRALNDANAELIGATLDVLALRRNESFLDVGFGGGRALEWAAGQTSGALWGVDFSPDMVREGQRRLAPLVCAGRLNLVAGDVHELPLRDGLLGALCTINTIYFWSDLSGALGELCRVLAPGGRAAFGYSGREKMQRFDALTRHGFTTFEPPDLEGSLRAAGFEQVATTALHGSATEGDFVTLATRPGG